MSGAELLIVGGGLVVGWVIVSKMMEQGTAPDIEPGAESPEAAAANWPAVLGVGGKASAPQIEAAYRDKLRALEDRA